MPYTYVHHIQRFCAKILGKLQIFMKTYTVGSAIAPVYIEVSGTILDRTDSTFPAESVLWRA